MEKLIVNQERNEIFIWANLEDYNPWNSLSESSEDYSAH